MGTRARQSMEHTLDKCFENVPPYDPRKCSTGFGTADSGRKGGQKGRQGPPRGSDAPASFLDPQLSQWYWLAPRRRSVEKNACIQSWNCGEKQKKGGDKDAHGKITTVSFDHDCRKRARLRENIPGTGWLLGDVRWRKTPAYNPGIVAKSKKRRRQGCPRQGDYSIV